jgi:hypothetical protein
MLSFLAAVVTAGIEPLSLAAGLFLGYLFHKEWKQLAWPLLLFVVPGIGGMDSSPHSHGALYLGVADFIAICLLTGGTFWAFEHFTTRRRAPKPRS